MAYFHYNFLRIMNRTISLTESSPGAFHNLKSQKKEEATLKATKKKVAKKKRSGEAPGYISSFHWRLAN
jgi:hypothetical protein